MNVFLMYIKSIVKEIVMNKLKTIVQVLDEKPWLLNSMERRVR